MSELTLESLAKRVTDLEIAVRQQERGRTHKDWRKVIGMFGDSEFMREVDEECLRARKAERAAARRGEQAE
ncbi:MAG: hypothetical protein JSS02_30615 [Planctomycetes bacterium]|nr:hypothetical protein [Planctomycetota bacterium]